MSNRAWPNDGKPVQFEDISLPVVNAIRQLYRMRFKGYRDVDWRGLDIGASEKACCYPPDKQLSREQLRYDSLEQGRPPLQVLVGLAVQLGIEQGRRIERERRDPLDRIDALYRTLRRPRRGD